MRKLHAFTVMVCLSALNILFINNLQAQNTWHEHSSTPQYKFEYSDVTVCTNTDADIQSEYIFLKITNFTSSDIQLSFRADMFYVGSGCVTCDNAEYIQRITIPANTAITGDCNFMTTGNRQLVIFKKFINKTNYVEFEKFEISQIQVN